MIMVWLIIKMEIVNGVLSMSTSEHMSGHLSSLTYISQWPQSPWTLFVFGNTNHTDWKTGFSAAWLLTCFLLKGDCISLQLQETFVFLMPNLHFLPKPSSQCWELNQSQPNGSPWLRNDSQARVHPAVDLSRHPLQEDERWGHYTWFLVQTQPSRHPDWACISSENILEARF